MLTIIGVVADSRFRTIQTPIEPIMFQWNGNSAYWLVARFRGDPATVRAGIERVWRSFAPDVAFDGEFADAIMERSYKRMDARAQMFGMFALLAVAGLLTALFVPRRRLWVKATPERGGDGVVIEYAGLARGEDPALSRAVVELSARTREALGLPTDLADIADTAESSDARSDLNRPRVPNWPEPDTSTAIITVSSRSST